VLNDSYRTDVCLLYAPHLIALAALYIICVVHAERYVENNSNNALGTSLNDDPSGGSISHTHSNIHLHSQLHNMATKKSGHHSNIPNTEGHGINNRNMVQWFADLNVEIEEVWFVLFATCRTAVRSAVRLLD